jgi:hypothetical protein
MHTPSTPAPDSRITGRHRPRASAFRRASRSKYERVTRAHPYPDSVHRRCAHGGYLELPSGARYHTLGGTRYRFDGDCAEIPVEQMRTYIYRDLRIGVTVHRTHKAARKAAKRLRQQSLKAARR